MRLKAKAVEIYCAAPDDHSESVSTSITGEYSPKWASIQLVNLPLILLHADHDFLTICAAKTGICRPELARFSSGWCKPSTDSKWVNRQH